MNRISYPSIENSYRDKTVSLFVEVGLKDIEWVVQEKIHGANFSIYIDLISGKVIRYASRNQFVSNENLGENELVDFYSFETIRKNLEKEIAKLSPYYSFKTAVLFGELCGGYYPGMSKVPGVSKVQGEVAYSPNIEFFVFDVVLLDDKGTVYLDVDQIPQFLFNTNINYVKTLFKGNLEECLQYPNNENSTIPAQLGLPTLEKNIMEGVVIRPQTTRFVGCERVILKNKNNKFGEGHIQKNRETLFNKNSPKECEYFLEYVNENRLSNVLSKCTTNGKYVREEIGKVIKEFSTDVFKDFYNDYDYLDSDSKKSIQKFAGKVIAEFIIQRAE